MYVRDLLAAHSCDLLSAVSDGQAAVDATAKLLPDVVVLDLSMPVLNGIERSEERRVGKACTSRLTLTVEKEPDTSRSGGVSGDCGYVPKPHLPTYLSPAI